MTESFSQLEQFFSELEPDERERLLAGEGSFEKRNFFEGNIIFCEGDSGGEMYLIIEGQVEISKLVGKEKKQKKVFSVLTKGSIFGEGSLLSDRPHSATVTAITDLETLVLSRDKFHAFLDEKPDDAVNLLMALLRMVNHRLVITSQELVEMIEDKEDRSKLARQNIQF